MVNLTDRAEGAISLIFGPGVTQMAGSSSAGFTSVSVNNGLVLRIRPAGPGHGRRQQ
jgi:hypothetical protein